MAEKKVTNSPIGVTWEELEKEIFTPEEIAASDARIERLVRSCVADLAFEGLICTEEDKAAMRRISTGETALETELATVVAKYQEE